MRAARAGSSFRILANSLIVIHSPSEARKDRIFRSVPSFAAGRRPAPARLPPQPFSLLTSLPPSTIHRLRSRTLSPQFLPLLFAFDARLCYTFLDPESPPVGGGAQCSGSLLDFAKQYQCRNEVDNCCGEVQYFYWVNLHNRFPPFMTYHNTSFLICQCVFQDRHKIFPVIPFQIRGCGFLAWI